MAAHPKIDTSTLDHIKRLAEGQTELAKAVGRGQPALRDPAGNILALNPASSTPLLVAQSQDVALNMREGGIYVVDETGQNAKALAALNINASGDVTAEGSITAEGSVVAPEIHGMHRGDVYGTLHGNSHGTHRGPVGSPGELYTHYGDCHGVHFGAVNPQVQGPVGPEGPPGPKGFVIDHPSDPDRWMIHACTEAPRNGVEYSGVALLADGTADVTLPDYFEGLTRVEDRSVHLTVVAAPHGTRRRKRWMFGSGAVSATYPRDGRFRIIADAPDVSEVWWLVKAVRADLPELLVEPLRSEVTVSGIGPYRTYHVVTDPDDPAQQLPDTAGALIRTLWAAVGAEQARTDELAVRIAALEAAAMSTPHDPDSDR